MTGPLQKCTLACCALTLSALALMACPGPSSPNPPQFWIAPNGSEIRIKLVPVEPDPF